MLFGSGSTARSPGRAFPSYCARSRRTVVFFPLILTCLIAEITSLAADFGNLDDRKPIRDRDRPDLVAAQMGLVGDGPDQVLGPDPGAPPDPDVEAGYSAPAAG